MDATALYRIRVDSFRRHDAPAFVTEIPGLSGGERSPGVIRRDSAQDRGSLRVHRQEDLQFIPRREGAALLHTECIGVRRTVHALAVHDRALRDAESKVSTTLRVHNGQRASLSAAGAVEVV